MQRLPPVSTLFPYTTLFRSRHLRLRRPPARRLALRIERRSVPAAGRRRQRHGSAPAAGVVARSAHEGNLAWLTRSEEHTSELQSLRHLVCRLLLEKNKEKQE